MWEAHDLVKMQAASFPQFFAKINTAAGIFQGFYLKFKQFFVVCNVSRFSNGSTWQFEKVIFCCEELCNDVHLTLFQRSVF